MSAPAISGCAHSIDDNDFITFVSAEWLSFAHANQARHLTHESIVGTSLWDHITEPTTRYLYRTLLQQVRESDTPVSIPFRCDSPSMRRQLELTMHHHGNGIVVFQSRVIQQESRLPVEFLTIDTARSEESITMCSWCKKVSIPHWVEVEEAVAELRLYELPSVPGITHGICDLCQVTLLREAGRL